MEHGIVNILQKRGYGTTNLNNLQSKIEDILEKNKRQELKLNSIRDIIGNNHSPIGTLRISISEALINYDIYRKMAEMVLKIDGMEEAIIDKLESTDFIVTPSS